MDLIQDLETKMRDLTPEDEKFLVEYCMQPENTWFALAIGQIQPKLKGKIVSTFVRKLDESVNEALKKIEMCGFHWETRVPETKLEEKKTYSLFILKVQGIEIRLGVWGGGYLLVFLPKGTELDLRWDEVIPDMDVKLKSNDSGWWFDAEERHHIRSLEALNALLDDELREEKIAYFTDVFVRLVKNILKVLEA